MIIMGIKEQILNAAYILMDQIDDCDDYSFVEEVVAAISNNDKELLWNLEEQMNNVSPKENVY